MRERQFTALARLLQFSDHEVTILKKTDGGGGGSGWEAGFVFGQAAQISYNVAFRCQHGPAGRSQGV